MAAQVACPHCVSIGVQAQTVIRGHVFTRETRDHPRLHDMQQWRWLCGCGARGKWTAQSDSVPYHAWLKHAGGR